MFERAVWFVPAAAPAGRACVNLPVANTRFPTMTWDHTTPLIWTVGNAAADTVSGNDGSTGAVSAAAVPLIATTSARFALNKITASRPDAERRMRPRVSDISFAPNTMRAVQRRQQRSPSHVRLVL